MREESVLFMYLDLIMVTPPQKKWLANCGHSSVLIQKQN